jgi:Xaa-Pro aminopeptidase
MEGEEIDALLAYGNAFEVPDMYWLTGFRSSDNIIVFKNRGEETIVASAFHTIERVVKEGFIKKTFDLSEVIRDLMREGQRPQNRPDMIYGKILKELFTGKVIGVPDHLPVRVLLAIQELGYEVKSVPDLLLQARATKSSREIKMIEKAATATTAAMIRAVEMIKDSDIGSNKTLMHNGSPLTVGQIKLALEHFLVDQYAESASDSIVSVGAKGFDWHYLGSPEDELKAEVPIIIDVFPRLKIERYVGDVTRTIVKGKVPDEVRKMFDGVAEVVDNVADVLAAGVKIDEEVNMVCYETLKKHGFDSTRLNPEITEGMTHGLGHGIGLNVHEYPSLYDRTALFEEGHVTTVEPGVYFKKLGGVRIENDYAVTKTGAKRLSTGLEDVLYV